MSKPSSQRSKLSEVKTPPGTEHERRYYASVGFHKTTRGKLCMFWKKVERVEDRAFKFAGADSEILSFALQGSARKAKVGMVYCIQFTEDGHYVVSGPNAPTYEGNVQASQELEKWRMESGLAVAAERQGKVERAARKQLGEGLESLKPYREFYQKLYLSSERTAFLGLVIREVTSR